MKKIPGFRFRFSGCVQEFRRGAHGAPRRILLAVFGLALAGQAVAAGITATIEPREFSTDHAARLTVTVSGASTSEPAMPSVPGLQLQPEEQSTRMQIINGAISTSQSYTYRVAAREAGAYVIPPIGARLDGTMQKTRPIQVTVTKGTGRNRAFRAPAPAHRRGTASATPVSAGEADNLAFLRVHVSDHSPYVGELVPVQIKAYFLEELQAGLNGAPVLNGNAFTLHSLSAEPQRTREVVGQHVYSVLTWYTGMSAVKAGEFRVSAQLDATLLVPRSGSSHARRDPFGGDLFDSFFGGDPFAGVFGQVEERNVTLAGENETIHVLALPEQGRPEHFGGAVGRFDLSVGATPRDLNVGDPVTVRIEVKGYGNFDRVTKPRFTREANLKVYSPSQDFEARDTIGYEGSKTFEQAVIPRGASPAEIPSMEFSYFDPETEQYGTTTSDPIPLRIKQAASGEATRSAPLVTPEPEPGAAAEEEEKQVQYPAALQIELGATSRSLHPAVLQPWFWMLQIPSLAALFLGFVLCRRRTGDLRNPGRVKRKETRYAVDRAMRTMDRAVNGGDVPGFFHACRVAAQERLGELWGMEPPAITLADLRLRIPDATGLLRVFETADAVAYAGQSYSQDELRTYLDALKEELASLETKS